MTPQEQLKQATVELRLAQYNLHENRRIGCNTLPCHRHVFRALDDVWEAQERVRRQKDLKEHLDFAERYYSHSATSFPALKAIYEELFK